MKTIKVIDLLVKIAKGDKVPKIVKVLDKTLLPKYQIITWNEFTEKYEYCDGFDFDRELDKYHLNDCVEIIEDTPEDKQKENKKIELIKEEVWELNNSIIKNKINEMINKINGE